MDVPWDQALDVVLKNYQLGGQLQGNVLRIATAHFNNPADIDTLIQALDRIAD